MASSGGDFLFIGIKTISDYITLTMKTLFFGFMTYAVNCKMPLTGYVDSVFTNVVSTTGRKPLIRVGL